MKTHAFEAIGTLWSIDTENKLSAEILKKLKVRINEFDRVYSRFRTDSLVTAMSKSAGVYEFPQDATELFNLYDRLFDLTDGAVNPLVGETLAALGYDAEYSFKRQAELPEVQPWNTTVKRKGCSLTLTQPALIDVGAAGKGYLTDLLGKILEKHGIDNYIIDASGDILHRSDRSETIALADPADNSRAIGKVNLIGQSLCASSASIRRWGDSHHIIDGRSGRPTRQVSASWVVADSGLLADGLATALFFAPPDTFKEFNFDYAIMYADGSVQHNQTAAWEFFTA